MDKELEASTGGISEIIAIRRELESLLERADSCSLPMVAIKIDEAINFARLAEAEAVTGG